MGRRMGGFRRVSCEEMNDRVDGGGFESLKFAFIFDLGLKEIMQDKIPSGTKRARRFHCWTRLNFNHKLPH